MPGLEKSLFPEATWQLQTPGMRRVKHSVERAVGGNGPFLGPCRSACSAVPASRGAEGGRKGFPTLHPPLQPGGLSCRSELTLSTSETQIEVIGFHEHAFLCQSKFLHKKDDDI